MKHELVKNRKEINRALKQMLNFYDSYRTVLKLSKSAAQRNVEETYSDFYEWLQGDLDGKKR
jgi:hypothetical protein